MGKRKKAVKRGIDTGRSGVVAKGHERVQGHHFILKLDASVKLLQGKKPIEIKSSKARSLDAAKVSSATFYPHYFFYLPINWISNIQLGTGVSTTKVCDAQV